MPDLWPATPRRGTQSVRALSMDSKRRGNSGWYFSALKWASENGLSFEVCLRPMGFEHAEIGQHQGGRHMGCMAMQ